MPSPLWLLISMLVVVGSQDYHYQPPQTPFTAETYHQPQAPQQPQTTKFVVQTLGRTYGLETQRAPAIYEDHQTQVIRVLEQRQLQQQPQTYYQAPQQQQQYSYPATFPQQLHTSSYTNPLLVSASYQAPPQALAPPAPAPPSQPLSYYQPQQQQQPLVPAHQRSPAPIVGYSTARQQALQPGTQYLPPQQPPPQKLFFGNPQPYASVTIGGQQVLDAGHGSGVAPNEVQVQLVAATGQQPQQSRIGDHVAQSQGAQVDGYDYKQTSPGDTRDYQRFVTNCGPGGQCQRKELGPGEVDPTHQRVLQFTRSSTQPRIEGCFKSPVIYVPVGAEVNNQGQLRPKNRRQNERQEQILSRYPYN